MKILLFIISSITISITNLYSQNEVSTYWDFVIYNPESTDMYINDIYVLNTNEFGVFHNEDTTFAFEVYFRLYTSEDTLFISCSSIYTNCKTYEYHLSKKIIMRKNNILDKRFKLCFVGIDYKFSINVKPKHGNYIFFNDNAEIKNWKNDYMFMQNTQPFIYGSSPPKRVK
jgi:hypothetical protein